MTTPTEGFQSRQQRELALRDVVMGFTLVVNVCALVWGAAKLSSTVEELGRTTARLALTIERIDSGVDNQEARIQVLEDRLTGGRNGR